MRQRRQARKLDVPITKEVTEPSGGGIFGYVVKFVLFVILVLIGLYFIGLAGDNGPIKELTESD